ncbi:hypothetical protein SAY86_002158 [Trapa natans]|uniref:Uncharacterized protein n=1 Tax=Trapa natans TaxID=22666 RepID=A0AAN7LIQ2_TRANT|nr:hypothetical protein SAY86_002158 [Trapa natans]
MTIKDRIPCYFDQITLRLQSLSSSPTGHTPAKNLHKNRLEKPLESPPDRKVSCSEASALSPQQQLNKLQSPITKSAYKGQEAAEE